MGLQVEGVILGMAIIATMAWIGITLELWWASAPAETEIPDESK